VDVNGQYFFPLSLGCPMDFLATVNEMIEQKKWALNIVCNIPVQEAGLPHVHKGQAVCEHASKKPFCFVFFYMLFLVIINCQHANPKTLSVNFIFLHAHMQKA
jgi:hypothetical protein